MIKNNLIKLILINSNQGFFQGFLKELKIIFVKINLWQQ